MSEQNWEEDVLSAIYREVWPVMWAGHRIVAKALSGNPDIQAELDHFLAAEDLLKNRGQKMMQASGVAMSEQDISLVRQQGDTIRSVREALHRAASGLSRDNADALLDRIETDLHPAVNTAVNRFRRSYIGFHMDRQSSYARQAQHAIQGLNRISKQIFIIAINAGVEAARVGDAGRGFQEISAEMRMLSQSAETATNDLTSLVAANSQRQ